MSKGSDKGKNACGVTNFEAGKMEQMSAEELLRKYYQASAKRAWDFDDEKWKRTLCRVAAPVGLSEPARATVPEVWEREAASGRRSAHDYM